MAFGPGVLMKGFRVAIDALMVLVLPLLMTYSLIGELFHEVAGMLMLVLFIVHHWLNRHWYTNLFKGRYSALRIFRTVLNSILIVLMVAQPVSGILMSKHLYTFIDIPGIAGGAREIHLCLAYWFFILMCIHAGTHLSMFIKKSRVAVISMAVIAAYGIWAFVKRRFAQYMFLRTSFMFFDFDEPRILFLLDYISVMVLFVLLGYGINQLLAKKGPKRTEN